MNRRDFLKATGLMGLALLAPPLHAKPKGIAYLVFQDIDLHKFADPRYMMQIEIKFKSKGFPWGEASKVWIGDQRIF